MFSFISFHSVLSNFKAKYVFGYQYLSSKSELSVSKSCLDINYQNICGIYMKLLKLNSNFVLLTYDVYILTETWLELTPNGIFYFLHSDFATVYVEKVLFNCSEK